TDSALLHRAGLRPVERLEGMEWLHVFAVCVVQRIKRLGDDRVREDEVAAVLELPLDRRVSHSADAMGASQEDWTFKKPGFLDPIDAGHVTVTVQVERGGEDRIPIAARSRKNGGDSGANRALAWYQLALTFDEGDV